MSVHYIRTYAFMYRIFVSDLLSHYLIPHLLTMCSINRLIPVHFYVSYFMYLIVLMLRDVSRTNTSITINWYPDETSYCGPVICYNVAIRNFSFIFTDKTTETNFKFSNLMSRTSYNISVAAINRAGTGPASAITLTTLTDDEDGKYCLIFMYMQYKCNSVDNDYIVHISFIPVSFNYN